MPQRAIVIDVLRADGGEMRGGGDPFEERTLAGAVLPDEEGHGAVESEFAQLSHRLHRERVRVPVADGDPHLERLQVNHAALALRGE